MINSLILHLKFGLIIKRLHFVLQNEFLWESIYLKNYQILFRTSFNFEENVSEMETRESTNYEKQSSSESEDNGKLWVNLNIKLKRFIEFSENKTKIWTINWIWRFLNIFNIEQTQNGFKWEQMNTLRYRKSLKNRGFPMTCFFIL